MVRLWLSRLCCRARDFLADDRAAGDRVVRLAATDVMASISALEHLSHECVRRGWVNPRANADIQPHPRLKRMFSLLAVDPRGWRRLSISAGSVIGSWWSTRVNRARC
ncbi:hypothetical protein MES5069_140028 [Mesorhizobium escarrei]|uniref:Uncharacterized protein n=1 Tax=Mesorhizobium escarrei TaxID=666018 RepID=A0ABN8JHC8_9HYPH|nr:hypothetical protein MES5069_140028 [Mesorhizobium escarrei]